MYQVPISNFFGISIYPHLSIQATTSNLDCILLLNFHNFTSKFKIYHAINRYVSDASIKILIHFSINLVSTLHNITSIFPFQSKVKVNFATFFSDHQ